MRARRAQAASLPPMPTPAERQALLFVAAVTALGVGARAWRAMDGPPATPEAASALADQLARVDSAIAAGGIRRARPGLTSGRGGASQESSVGRSAERPPAHRDPGAPVRSAPRVEGPTPPTEPIDVDRASAEELDRLPGVGPALAARIVEERTRLGPFGSMDALDRVRGIGPALTERLREHVTFSGAPRPPDTEGAPARRVRRP